MRLLCANLLSIRDCLFDYRSNSLRIYASIFAVLRLEPNRKLFLAFACIAPDATQSNIFSGNDFRIIDDVFPTRY